MEDPKPAVELRPKEDEERVEEFKLALANALSEESLLHSEDIRQIVFETIENRMSDIPDEARIRDIARTAAQSIAKQGDEDVLKKVSKIVAKVIEAVQPQVMYINTSGIDGEDVELEGSAHPALKRLITNLLAKIPTFMIGPAGCGKTYAASQLASTFDLNFGSLSCTAGASETWVYGRQTPTGFIQSSFCDVYENGGIFLFDELDASDPNFLLAINSAIANNEFHNPIEGRLYKKHEKFFAIAASNTFGTGPSASYVGRSRLDAATLDRFKLGRVLMDYDNNLERVLCGDQHILDTLWKMRAHLRSYNSEHFVSTRNIKDAGYLFLAGKKRLEIYCTIMTDWPDNVRNAWNESNPEVCFDSKVLTD